MNCQIWSLEKYARMVNEPSTSGTSKDGWQATHLAKLNVEDNNIALFWRSGYAECYKHDEVGKWVLLLPPTILNTYTNDSENIELTLTSSHQLLIHYGHKLMVSNMYNRQVSENISLSAMSKCLKGVSRGDSLLIVYKMSERSHRFRVKFLPSSTDSGETRCRTCSQKLGQYFNIMLPETSTTGSSSQQILCTPENVSILKGDVTMSQLSDAILSNTTQLPELYQSTEDTDIDLNTIIKLCLSDTSFPAFVGQVEKELEKIKTEC